MPTTFPDPAEGEPFLLTPGPLTTSPGVKKAMLRDWGSWDGDFRAMTRDMRSQLLAIAGQTDGSYDCVPIQGSGSYCVEAMLGSFVPKAGKVLVLANGAYGLRAAKTVEYLGRGLCLLDKGDYLPPRGEEVATILRRDTAITHVLAIHCETSTGILNPIEEIAEAVHEQGRKLLIDSMSAFGALPLDPLALRCTAFTSSANKCIEGVPGFGFVIARTDEISASKGNSHSLALDIFEQWNNMEKSGQWRFTPPTHSVAAFMHALEQHTEEGGAPARLVRYKRNRDEIVSGFRTLGFETLLPDRWLSPIIVTFFCPTDPAFNFDTFYNAMKTRGFIIYPGKLTIVDSFRIGCIGHMDHTVMKRVVEAARDSLSEMGVCSAAPSATALEERNKLTA
ncbi:MAG: 2-aminoethylphosphonate--pyruvate transaminase [Gammaproteobacteria bacterium]|nr:2-aminoethylphosphonate--pyruvate transaminase [Gammaproteobacteria bacterium]